jgi:hypothetical protein
MNGMGSMRNSSMTRHCHEPQVDADYHGGASHSQIDARESC